MSINCRIIEGDYSIVDEETYEAIKKDYSEMRISVYDIREKYNLNSRKWQKIRGRIIDEVGFQRVKSYGRRIYPTKTGRLKPNYYAYSSTSDVYRVQKYMGDRSVYFGTFKTEEQAKEAVKMFQENGWDKSKLWEVYEKVKK